MTTPNSRMHNLRYLLKEGGTKVSRALFDQRVKDFKPSEQESEKWTVNTFLQANKSKILSTRMGKDRECTIFGEGDKMSFDLDTLCFLLLEVCGLTKDLRTCLHQLRYITGKLLYPQTGTSDNDYEHFMKQLKHIIRRCQAEIKDTSFTAEVDKILERLDSGTVPQSDLTSATQYITKMRVPLYSVENLKSNHFSDGDKLDIVIEQMRYIDARLNFTSLTALHKDDVDKEKEKKKEEAYVGVDLKHEHPKSLSSPMMEKL